MYTLIIFSLALLAACQKKKHPCYSAELEKQYADKYCTMEYRGVLGCDGKTYANACEAAKYGIRIVN
jgi:nitrous oxide reductase accessory protein NosL